MLRWKGMPGRLEIYWTKETLASAKVSLVVLSVLLNLASRLHNRANILGYFTVSVLHFPHKMVRE